MWPFSNSRDMLNSCENIPSYKVEYDSDVIAQLRTELEAAKEKIERLKVESKKDHFKKESFAGFAIDTHTGKSKQIDDLKDMVRKLEVRLFTVIDSYIKSGCGYTAEDFKCSYAEITEARELIADKAPADHIADTAKDGEG